MCANTNTNAYAYAYTNTNAYSSRIVAFNTKLYSRILHLWRTS
jgi:hypothetical protein